jgi:galactokinase
MGTAQRSASPDWTASHVVAEVRQRLKKPEQAVLTRAPGRLDVMGGLAEYSGGLILTMPLAEHVCVGVEPADDGQFTLITSSRQVPNYTEHRVPLEAIRGRGADAVDPHSNTVLAEGDETLAARAVLGSLVELQRANLLDPAAPAPARQWDRGLRVVVGSTLKQYTDVGEEAAIVAATLAALCRAFSQLPEPQDAAVVGQAVMNHWVGWPVATADLACSLLGEPHTLSQLCCDPFEWGPGIRLPDDVTVVGIDTGAGRDDNREKYTQVRTTSFMGRVLIERLFAHEQLSARLGDGHLARVSVTDYVERLRDRLPAKLKGEVFLSRFGETGDPLTRVDPRHTYKVRSRTEHHIYENSRAHQFSDCLRRAMRLGDPGALAPAGELMYGSHWSYGQRCGLGSVEADVLMNLLREHGPRADICGARISGHGCGGVVVVLMQATDRAQQALQEVLDEYKARTGQTARSLKGSAAGVLVAGPQDG